MYVAYGTGGRPNPAVAIARIADHMFNPEATLNGPALAEGGIPVTIANAVVYIVAEFLGAFAGAILCQPTFKQYLDESLDPALKLGVFSTAPEIRSYGQSTLTEAIGTAILILWTWVSDYTRTVIRPLTVTPIIIVTGNSLGGPTGYTINPTRDLGSRVAHAVLPIKGRGGSDQGYSWVPIVGSTIGTIVDTVIAFVTGLAQSEYSEIAESRADASGTPPPSPSL